MTNTQLPVSNLTLPPSQGLRYGLLGFPLAFVALPLYVQLPHLYATRYGVSLTLLGSTLMLARLFDALTDPLMGRWIDLQYTRSSGGVQNHALIAALVLAVGMALILFPPWQTGDMFWPLVTALLPTYLALGYLTMAHQTWGARLGGNDVVRTKIVAWREGAGVAGVVVASIVPPWLGWTAWTWLWLMALVVGWLAWRCSTPLPASNHLSPPPSDPFYAWRHAPFRRLMLVYVLNGMASAIPATLVLFFVEDRLKSAGLAPWFLGLYFCAAAISLPVWMKAVARWGLTRSWLTGMLLSVAAFAWTGLLAGADRLAFSIICSLSGTALGADLAVPGALLARTIEQRGDQGQLEGAYFGWWTLAGKLNMAAAAGLALPLLAFLGYAPGDHSVAGLTALTGVYAVVPCVLKLIAATVLYLSPPPPLEPACLPSPS